MIIEKFDRDEMLKKLEELKELRHSKTAVLDTRRLDQIREDHRKLCQLVGDPAAKVTCCLLMPFDHTSNITVEADDLILFDPKGLAEVISRSDHVEVYPLTNGKVRMVLHYENLVRYEEP